MLGWLYKNLDRVTTLRGFHKSLPGPTRRVKNDILAISVRCVADFLLISRALGQF